MARRPIPPGATPASLLLACAVVLGAPGAARAAPAACLAYEPAIVTVRGQIERLDDGAYLLQLKAPICMKAAKNDASEIKRTDVRRVQLVLETATEMTLRPLLGKDVSLSGSLGAAEPGHPHAVLVLGQVKLAK